MFFRFWFCWWFVFCLVGVWGFFEGGGWFVARYNTEKQGNISEPHFLILTYCKLPSAQRAEYSHKLNEKINFFHDFLFILCILLLHPLSPQTERLLHTCTQVYLHISTAAYLVTI